MTVEGDELLDEIDALLDRLAAAELSGSEEVVRLHRSLARLDATLTKTVGRWDAAGVWRADGARSAPAWLAGRCRTPLPSARRRVRLARRLRDLPVVAAAWEAGDIESGHVSAFCGARNDRTAELLARDEASLVDDARSMRFAHFSQALAYWLLHADPDGSEVQAERDEDDRRLDLSETFHGTWVGDFSLPPVPGTIVSTTLAAIERELFEADWADAKDRLGRDPSSTSWPAPPSNAGPTPSWRWPSGPAPPRRTAAAPNRSSPSSSATSASSSSASSAAPSSPPAPSSPGSRKAGSNESCSRDRPA